MISNNNSFSYNSNNFIYIIYFVLNSEESGEGHPLRADIPYICLFSTQQKMRPKKVDN